MISEPLKGKRHDFHPTVYDYYQGKDVLSAAEWLKIKLRAHGQYTDWELVARLFNEAFDDVFPKASVSLAKKPVSKPIRKCPRCGSEAGFELNGKCYCIQERCDWVWSPRKEVK